MSQHLVNEKSLLNLCIEEGYVSSVGRFVNQFENVIKNFTGSKNSVAVARNICLTNCPKSSGVKKMMRF